MFDWFPIFAVNDMKTIVISTTLLSFFFCLLNYYVSRILGNMVPDSGLNCVHKILALAVDHHNK